MSRIWFVALLTVSNTYSQMVFFAGHGYRVIAHDRRCHGRATQVGDGHDMNDYADDLAAAAGGKSFA